MKHPILPPATGLGRRLRRGFLSFWILAVLGVGIVWALPDPRVMRFSDTPYLQSPLSSRPFELNLSGAANEANEPVAPANGWLDRNGWEQLWPLKLFGKGKKLFFAGPPALRYLQLLADKTFFIWGRRLEVDPQQYPVLLLTWGVDRFPRGAALDLYGRNDRSIVVTVSFGPKVKTPGFLPDVPRGLAFFWGETETVGTSYTCIVPREGPRELRLQCKYPHIKYIALRRGGAGSVHTDRVNLVEMFQQQFPDYWNMHRRVPPIVGVAFEARSDKTQSVSRARLYAISFMPAVELDGQISGSTPERK